MTAVRCSGNFMYSAFASLKNGMRGRECRWLIAIKIRVNKLCLMSPIREWKMST